MHEGQNLTRDQYLRWQITTAFDIASEILILCLPIDIIWTLQMKTKTKLGVISRFWLRLPVLALAVGHFLYVRNLLFAQDVGIASNEKIIMQEIEMMVSVSTNVIITLRPFAKDFNTSFGQGGGATVAYGISKAYGGNSGGGVKSSSRNNDRGLGSITANRLGLSSKSGSMGKSGPRSWGAEKAGADGVELEGWRKSSYKKAERRMLETSDSSKDLTGDVITQTIDYQVEYEEKSEEGERSRGSERW